MKNPTVGSSLFRAFPSDRIPKTTKDGNLHFFIHIFTFRDKLIIVSANSENFLKLPRIQCCQFKGDGYRQRAPLLHASLGPIYNYQQDFVIRKA
jgi:hypothetical protein